MVDRGLVEKARLLTASGRLQETLHGWARELREEHFGTEVFVRGVVEVSNFCRQNCNYCGMRRENRGLERYRMSRDQLLDIILNHRPKSITDLNIQAGEDPIAVHEIVIPLVREIRRRTNLGVSVCLGTLSFKEYGELMDSGATYYIIKLETGDEEHYRALQAPGTLARRIEAIRHLASAGWNVSSGFIVGLPHQTQEHILKTLTLLEKLPLAGSSVSPFVPGGETPLAAYPYGDLNLALNCLALMRIASSKRIIPAVSAMTFQDGTGYMQALQAGANLATINLTPSDFRKNYIIYRQDRVIMNEEKVLRAIEQVGCVPSSSSLCGFLNGQRPAKVAVAV